MASSEIPCIIAGKVITNVFTLAFTVAALSGTENSDQDMRSCPCHRSNTFIKSSHQSVWEGSFHKSTWALNLILNDMWNFPTNWTKTEAHSMTWLDGSYMKGPMSVHFPLIL